MWFKDAIGREKIDHMFAGNFPLEDVQLESLTFHGSKDLRLQFLCKNIPGVVPDKWRRQRYNAISLTFSMINIYSLNIQGGEIGFVCAPRLSTCSEKSVLNIENCNFKLDCESRFLVVEGFTPYIDERWG
ncbi:Imm50 family immunity protein [Pseudomonas massiliensis]|uniref:Imm50 family immunity protein n=1 Tax=Pseudomonas massiliensis TaxID=522492 RepID=UPI000A03E375|nr:Imm50 family immunity protein [Pseudomonas massiliensis]